jgi:DNA-binding response OmpR family regulator
MKKILVVDDDVDILTVVELILTRNNYLVEAISKWQYLAYSIQFFKPDLIILDISLGSADGREICKQLKSANETQNIPVILFSAFQKYIENLNDCYPDAIIPKPFETKQLVDIVNKTLSKL